MNKVEKFAYNLIKSNPALKNAVRNIYQSFWDTLPQKEEYTKNPLEYAENYFFGFHDVSPFSLDNKKVLSNYSEHSLTMPKNNDPLKVGYFEFDNCKISKYIEIDKSFSWNYHKGCRLQWLSEDKVIFNTVLNEQLISKVIDINTRDEKIINFPIDTVSPDGNRATSFSYERLNKLMPGYGYNYKDGGKVYEKAPESTGLFLIDVKDNTRKLIVSLSELADSVHDKESKHYVTHTEFSKDGRYISFLHRWTKDDTRKRKTRLIIFDTLANTMLACPTQGMVSHYVWNSNNQIVAYCTIDGVDSHVIFEVPKVNEYKKICVKKINSDGHQSFISDNKFITDTYPNKMRMAKIFVVDIMDESTELIASLYSPKEFQTRDFNNHIACDLHPRSSHDGRYISFDAIRNGRRSFCIMKL